MSYLVWLLVFMTFWLGGCTTEQRLSNEARVLYCIGFCSVIDFDQDVKTQGERREIRAR